MGAISCGSLDSREKLTKRRAAGIALLTLGIARGAQLVDAGASPQPAKSELRAIEIILRQIPEPGGAVDLRKLPDPGAPGSIDFALRALLPYLLTAPRIESQDAGGRPSSLPIRRALETLVTRIERTKRLGEQKCVAIVADALAAARADVALEPERRERLVEILELCTSTPYDERAALEYVSAAKTVASGSACGEGVTKPLETTAGYLDVMQRYAGLRVDTYRCAAMLIWLYDLWHPLVERVAVTRSPRDVSFLTRNDGTPPPVIGSRENVQRWLRQLKREADREQARVKLARRKLLSPVIEAERVGVVEASALVALGEQIRKLVRDRRRRVVE
jgi:hypothetical protein